MNRRTEILIPEGATHTEISRLTGIPRQTVAYRLARHGHIGPLKGHMLPPNARPVTIGGVRYPSISRAARDLDLIHEVLRHRLAVHGEDGLNADGSPKKPHAKAGYIDGVFYPSIAAAARATGIKAKDIHLVMKETP